MTQNDRHWRWATPQPDGAAAAPSAEPSLLPPVLSRRDRWAAAIADRLPPTLRGRWALDRTTGIVLAVSVLLGALLIGGWAVLRAKPHEMSVARERPLGSAPGARPESVPTVPVAATPGSGAVGPGSGSGAAGSGSGAGEGAGVAVPGAGSGSGSGPGSGLVVDVEGKVPRPGVRSLPIGSRILDAINAAGGALPGTDLTSLNQAQLLVDGEQVLVGVTPPPQNEPSTGPGRGKKGRGRAGLGGAQPVHLNSASVEDLEQLPGIGPALAQRVVDYRTEHGPFHSVEDLRQVSGFGGQRFASIAPMVAL